MFVKVGDEEYAAEQGPLLVPPCCFRTVSRAHLGKANRGCPDLALQQVLAPIAGDRILAHQSCFDELLEANGIIGFVGQPLVKGGYQRCDEFTFEAVAKAEVVVAPD